MCRFFESQTVIPDPRFALPGSKANYAPNRDFKTEHIKMEFSFDFTKKIVFGKTTHYLRMFVDSDKIEFDAINMKIDSVKCPAKKVFKHDYDGNKLVIYLEKRVLAGEPVEITIEYKIIRPALGVYFISPDKAYPKRPVQIWTHCETEEARYWYPCHDAPHEKFTEEMQITVPEDFFALSNGVLSNIVESKGKKTYLWKMKHPISSYLVMFAVGKFSEIRDEWDGIPVLYYCEKGQEEDTKRAFGKTPKMLDFFSRKTGLRYPFEKYAQVAVANFVFGGMEHTTATTQTDNVLHDERAHEECWHDGLVAHELAHQWFGDLITCKDWPHAWLNESFATYFDALFLEHDKGRDEFLYELYDNAKEYFTEDRDRYRRPIATNIYTDADELFDRHLYQKGALVLHMLRHILGETLWWKCISYYTNKNKNRTVETEDFINSIEEATGRNMKKFFDQWIYGAGHPELKATYYWDDKTKEAVIRIAQLQKADDQTPLFELPIVIEIITREGIKKFKETFSEKQKQFKYKVASMPLDVRIDPDNFLLKKLDFTKPRSMWIYQLENDKNILGKIAAIQELAKTQSGENAGLLARQFHKEKFWGVQAEIAIALSQMRNDTALRALEKMVEIKNVKARKVVVTAIGELREEKSFEILKKCFSSKEGYLTQAESAKSIGKLQHPSSMQFLKKNLNVESWNDVIKSGVLVGIAQMQNEEAIQILKEHSKYGYINSSRMAAIRNLGIIGKGRKDVLDLLIDLTGDEFSLVQVMAATALGDLGDERAIPLLEKLTTGHRDSRVKRQAQESIRKIYAWLETDLETAEMKERYEKLKKETESKAGKGV